jgi:hypothetical protein
VLMGQFRCLTEPPEHEHGQSGDEQQNLQPLQVGGAGLLEA